MIVKLDIDIETLLSHRFIPQVKTFGVKLKWSNMKNFIHHEVLMVRKTDIDESQFASRVTQHLSTINNTLFYFVHDVSSSEHNF